MNKVYKRQRGAVLLIFTAVVASFLATILASGFLEHKKKNEKFVERLNSFDVGTLVPEISEMLLRNPPLWNPNNVADFNFRVAIINVGFDWPQGLNVYISDRVTRDNIDYRNYVVCRSCPSIANPFAANGDFIIANIQDSAQDYHLINGYQLQVSGISRAQRKLADVAEIFSDAYTTLRRKELEGVLACIAHKPNSEECNYFRGCDFQDDSRHYGAIDNGGNGLLPCTEGEIDRRLAASNFGILGGDAFSIWGDIFVYNGGGDNGTVRSSPIALVTQGPFNIQVQLLIPEPI